jgi:hypothetical protein
VKRPAAHANAGVVAYAPEDLHLASGHSGCDMGTGVTIDDELAASHRRSDGVHVPNVADDTHLARVPAAHVEGVAEWHVSPATPHGERRDLSLAQSEESVGRDAISVDR